MIGDARVAARVRGAAQKLGLPVGTGDLSRVLKAFGDAADLNDRSHSYLLIAALRGSIPSQDQITDFARRWRLRGIRAAASPHVTAARALRTRVEIIDELLVDITDTSTSTFITGIQRVANHLIGRWSERDSVVPVRWAPGSRLVDASVHGRVRRLLVPFGARFALPEIAVEHARAAGIASLSADSRSTCLAVGFDTIPLTTAETTGVGMPSAFARYLTALARFDVVVPISSASLLEYRGWKRMLGGVGLPGPRLTAVDLPISVGADDPGSDEKVRRQIGVSSDERVILAVGSHEPRKNHLRLLEASEVLWERGDRFVLVLAGGNAWRAQRFERLVTTLRARGRRIVLLRTIDDTTLWALYRIARATVFCSLNEGFGLPLAESIAAGTPVITSGFGSMRDLGEGRGALLVDPRDAVEMASAIHSVLTDDALYARLAVETRTAPVSEWDRYADAVYSELVEAHRLRKAGEPHSVPTQARTGAG